MKVRVVRTGLAVPERVETAADLAPRVGKSERWILDRAGVAERRVADETVQSLAARAVKAALADDPPPDLLINASASPVQLIPDSSVFIQQALGWHGLGIPSFSIHATCLSFVVALQQAAALITAGAYRRIVVVSAEIATKNRDYREPESSTLLGDGAAAVLLEPTPEGEASALLGFEMSTWPEFSGLAEVQGCGLRHHPFDPETSLEHYYFHMNGISLYRAASTHVVPLLARILTRAGLSPDDVALVVPHQASGPVLDIIPKYGFPAHKVVRIIERYGNCVAASLPMALAVADAEGRLKRGDPVLMFGTGAGLSIAFALLRW